MTTPTKGLPPLQGYSAQPAPKPEAGAEKKPAKPSEKGPPPEGSMVAAMRKARNAKR